MSDLADECPPVLWLDEAQAGEPELAGAKAAALSSAAAGDLSVIPGFVITTPAAEKLAGDVGNLPPEVRAAWARLTEDGDIPLVVRSSSLAEDLGDTSMAGRFESVVGVADWDGFVAAVKTVLDSKSALADAGEDAGHAPLAVLVQRLVDAAAGGVMFSADPVTGDPEVVVVSAVDGGPDALVSGEVNGSTYRLTPQGQITSVDRAADGAEIEDETAERLASLARRSAAHFDDPQDMEWALDQDGALWLLQSRPMTTAVGVPTGPVLGPGPVSETFPDPLYPLEVDLWMPPLRAAVRHALLLSGTSERRLEPSPLVTALGGRVAVDLELFNAAPPTPAPWYARLDPRPRLRRLRAAWRVGRLRSALPALARDLIEDTDLHLSDVPPLDSLSSRQLVAVLHRASETLVALHGHEILVGLLAAGSQPQLTGTAVGIRILARARSEGLSDAEAVATHPSVLALAPPRISAVHDLPPTDLALGPLADLNGQHDGLLREALRLRVRWVQELQVRAALQLGRFLVETKSLSAAQLVRRLRLSELEEVVHGRAVPWQIHEQRREPDSRTLPAAFHLSKDGQVLPDRNSANGGGQGAGGGSGKGPVYRAQDSATPPEGCVLVVRTLKPELASHLPNIAGLVAETGSVLAHVAILAREQGVPTVVAVAGAYDEFDDGEIVAVDGTAGTVERADEMS